MSPLLSDQPISQYQRKAIHVFCSYAQQDKPLRDDLEKHLSTFKRSGLMTIWHNQEIAPGTEWKSQISTHLNTADIILLLLSSDFIASDYCYIEEMEHALKRHEAGEAHVIPILLRYVHWQDTPLGKLQVLPLEAEPITAWKDTDKALFHVADIIRQKATELRAQKERNYRVEEGRTYEGAGEYDKAEKAYAEILHVFPDHPDNIAIYQSRADLLRRIGRYEDAAEMYQKVINLNPKDFSLYHAFGDVLVELARHSGFLVGRARYNEALKAYKRAVEYDPTNVRLLQKQGDVLSNCELDEQALVAYNCALDLDSTNVMLYINIGYVLRCLKRYAEALDTYREGLKYDPVNVTLTILEGTTLCELQQYAPAVDAYDRAIALDAISVMAYVGKAFALFNLKRTGEAYTAHKTANMLGYSPNLFDSYSMNSMKQLQAPVPEPPFSQDLPVGLENILSQENKPFVQGIFSKFDDGFL
jgi:tetratricopeptide (TPR) repeat protein